MPIIDRLTEAAGVMGTAGYAHAVTVTGRLAFISGQVAFDETGHVVGVDDIRAQTRQAMRNVEAILTSLGAGWADVVKLGWYLVDVSAIQVVRDVRDEFLGDNPHPASTLIQVAALFRPEFLIEVDAVVALSA